MRKTALSCCYLGSLRADLAYPEYNRVELQFSNGQNIVIGPTLGRCAGVGQLNFALLPALALDERQRNGCLT